MKKYRIIWSPEFNKELNDILYYITFKLKEPIVSKKFFKKVLKHLTTLEYFPEGYSKLSLNNKIYRKLIVDKYTIIYQVKNNMRTSFYFTYISL